MGLMSVSNVFSSGTICCVFRSVGLSSRLGAFLYRSTENSFLFYLTVALLVSW